jgi:hypothetical protein
MYCDKDNFQHVLEDYEEEAQQLIHLSAETNTKIDSHIIKGILISVLKQKPWLSFLWI